MPEERDRQLHESAILGLCTVIGIAVAVAFFKRTHAAEILFVSVFAGMLAGLLLRSK